MLNSCARYLMSFIFYYFLKILFLILWFIFLPLGVCLTLVDPHKNSEEGIVVLISFGNLRPRD